MEIRLQKFLADCGIASRRKCEEYIQNSFVSVNGVVVTSMGVKINPEKDSVLFKGKKVFSENKNVYILLNKPIGYITTSKDEFNRKTVLDLIKNIDARIFPVGRLDADTSGLLILTNDGDLAYKLTHPKSNVNKTYLAKVRGIPTAEELKKFEMGLNIENYKTSPAKIKIKELLGKDCTLEITIHEGRNRQVRKMCAAIGHGVVTLERIKIGRLGLGKLQQSEYRFLNENEIEYLKNI